MVLETFLFYLNTLISILHPIKHIPQIIHTINTKRAEDLSKTNIFKKTNIKYVVEKKLINVIKI